MRIPRSTPLLAAALLAGCGFAPQPMTEEESRQVAAEVEAAHGAMLTAARAVDAEAFARMLSDDGRLLFNGTHMSNAEGADVARRAYAGLSAQEVDVIDQRVTVLGPEAAVVSGHGRVTAIDTSGGRDEPIGLAWTFVWARRDGAWRIVDSHQSFLPEP